MTMTAQRLVITFIPLEVLLIAAVAGGMAISGVRYLVDDVPSFGVSDTSTISPVFTPEVQHWSRKIAAWAGAYQLDPNLVATVMQIESCGMPSAVSSAGAQGLFQVMPWHFADEDDMREPQTNARRGLAYLALG